MTRLVQARGDVKHRDSGQLLTNYPKVTSFFELAIDREIFGMAKGGNCRITCRRTKVVHEANK
jgi:hypothetical protein